MTKQPQIEPYDGPAGGWGSVRSLLKKGTASGSLTKSSAILANQNKPEGFACVSCAWAKPAHPHPAEFCENGAKATFWELTSDRAGPDFFDTHTATEMRGWDDFQLESTGRLTHPMRFNHTTDRYEAVEWADAFADIGRELRSIRAADPRRVTFYASGRASLETSYMYQLLARLYGNNNLPDSSNMCHETTSVALPESIGVPVGTVRLDDFEKTDCILFFGQNVGSNSPRMLHDLQKASKRGVPIVTFNPLRERGLERFVNPQAPLEMLANDPTRISSHYFQVRAGGDIAALTGICKALLALDRAARDKAEPPVFDDAFIAEHTHGLDAFLTYLDATEWGPILDESGLTREALEIAAAVYVKADRVMAVYGMGLTQHKLGVDTVQLLVSLLLLRGNIGKDGAGICPVRGHSNVQGQRTVGITEKPELAPLDRLAELYRFEPPREKGHTTVEACKAILDDQTDAFIGLGGNFLRAVPERELMEAAWPRMRLTVQIATKLNRGHLFNGAVAYLLPCLGRIEIDEQASGPQTVTVEDSTSCIHASRGQVAPAAETLRSEARIVAELAKATLPDISTVPWDAWVDDYGTIREAIEKTWPDIFEDFNKRMATPGGFPKPLPARQRVWNTDTGKANFRVPKALSASFAEGAASDVLRLITLRSNDQFNTTVYGYDDRFRGVDGTRMVLFMNLEDMVALGVADRQTVGLETAVDDGVERRMTGFTVIQYNIPRGCCAAYYPECNALIPLWQYAEKSKVPAAKSVPVRLLVDAPGYGTEAAADGLQKQSSGHPPMLKQPIRYTPDVETIAADEAETIDGLNKAFDEILETTSEDYGHAVRAVHAKAHGILEGTMAVDADLPPELAQGMFAKPGEHKVYMRISTNAGDILPDAISLPRGVALKVVDVEGERLAGAEGTTQDFILVNGKVFQAKTADKFLGNLKMLAKTTDRMEGTKKVMSSVLRGVNTALTSVGIEVPAIASLGGAPNVDPLGETYYSVTPFRYGDYIAKFSLAPVSTDLTSLTGQEIDPSGRPDAIRETVQAEMRSRTGVWELRVQLCRDLEEQPVEDPTVEWDEEKAPFRRVATITMPPQDSWSGDRVQAVDEQMRFNIWTGLEAHQPLGNINRARREPYRHSSAFRSRFNGCPMHEPSE